jgi:hypothetical protein
MKYAYQRGGGPLVTWGAAAPKQSRAADAAALGYLGYLGSLGQTTLSDPTLLLPAPGAPEPILGGLSGCSCSGSCGCGAPASVGDLVDSVPGGYITLGVAAFLAWKLLGKGKRR